ncbi:MAG: sodium:calcium antiporter [Conexibacter sp.]
MRLLVGILAFGGGLWLLVESVEELVKSLRAWALAAGLSGVLVGALVLGFDVESTAAGVAATLKDLPGTALGTSIGAAIFLLTVGLGTAALIAPFAIRPPAALLLAAGAATALAIALCADGHLSRLDGGVLLVAFVPLVAAIVRWRPRDAAAPAGERPTRPTRLVPKVVAGLVGLVVGAELLVFGTERVVGELGLSESVFGVLVVGAAVSFEEVVLEALPAFRGFPELSVGNALGTLIFLLTGSLGVIALVRPIAVPASVTAYDLPALALVALLAGGLLARGRLGRPQGAVLLIAYALYAAGALLR